MRNCDDICWISLELTQPYPDILLIIEGKKELVLFVSTLTSLSSNWLVWCNCPKTPCQHNPPKKINQLNFENNSYDCCHPNAPARFDFTYTQKKLHNAKNTKAESITLIWLTDTEQMPILSKRESWKLHTADPLSDFDFVQ